MQPLTPQNAGDQVVITALHELEVCWTICGGVFEECLLFGGSALQLSPLRAESNDWPSGKYASPLFSSSRQSEVIRSLSAAKYVLVQSSDEACRANHKKTG